MSDELSGRMESRSFNGSDILVRSALPHPAPPQDRIWVHGALLLATIYTTTLAGMLMSPDLVGLDGQADDWTFLFNPRFLVYGLPFSVTLLGILGIHEMGHYVTSRWWHVRASLPYFIPFPSMIGTLGAVIRLKSRIPNRRALIDIGASGPLAGFVVAVIALGVGLHMSEVIAVQEVPKGAFSLGDSILSAWIGQLVIGHLPEGYDVMLHPVAFAGWLGLFVTVLNLLPMGQFDGGHIVYAIFGRRHAWITKGTLVALALFWAVGPPYDWMQAPDVFSVWLEGRWPGWLVWLFMGSIMGRRHPPPDDPYLPLDPVRKWVGYVSLVIFVLCFIPRPIYFAP
ncbi:MAG: site-2 protease family protein [bacterium]|nr:site-2 protease family protein [bacterium]